MSTKNVRKRKLPVDPVPDEKRKIKLDDAHHAVPRNQSTRNASKVKVEILHEIKLKDCTCKCCKQVFENPIERLRHSRTCQNFPRIQLPPNEVEKYFDTPNIRQCPVCWKPIPARYCRSDFIKHLLTHVTGLYHQCSICKQLFRSNGSKQAHEKRHIVSV